MKYFSWTFVWRFITFREHSKVTSIMFEDTMECFLKTFKISEGLVFRTKRERYQNEFSWSLKLVL